MNNQEVRRFQMLQRVRDFGNAHSAAFPAASFGHQLFATVTQACTDLQTHAATQVSGQHAAQESTSVKSALRAALHDELDAISQTARAMSITTPGLEQKFRLPRGNTNDEMLLASARAFAEDATPLQSNFVNYGMPATFLTDLNAHLNAFDQAVTDRHTGRATHVAARAAINDSLGAAFDAVRQLDALVRNKFRDDPATLAEWTSASHTQRAPHAAKNPPPPTP